MKNIMGILLIAVGVVLGLFLGVWICFIGGIVQVIEAIKTVPVHSVGIAVGLARIVSSTVVGWVSFFICGSFGASLLD